VSAPPVDHMSSHQSGPSVGPTPPSASPSVGPTLTKCGPSSPSVVTQHCLPAQRLPLVTSLLQRLPSGSSHRVPQPKPCPLVHSPRKPSAPSVGPSSVPSAAPVDTESPPVPLRVLSVPAASQPVSGAPINLHRASPRLCLGSSPSPVPALSSSVPSKHFEQSPVLCELVAE
jgi:hypothetical protein